VSWVVPTRSTPSTRPRRRRPGSAT
jgi:hypothetical protein